jgi:purine-nucleoside phosphorylase
VVVKWADISRRIEASAAWIEQRCWLRPEVAIVLGSGLGGLADRLSRATRLAYAEIPHFPGTTAQGHCGQMLIGYLAGMPVLVLQGRCHLYEGRSWEEVVFGTLCAQALGARTLIVTAAAGGIDSRLRVGGWMAIDQHIDWLFGRGTPTADFGPVESYAGVRTGRGGDIYSPRLIESARQVARRLGIDLPCGTYLSTLGPCYETRAEYRLFRRLGAACVGMSTVPEASAARRVGMQVLGLSVITNLAFPGPIDLVNDHQDVLDCAGRAEQQLYGLLTGLLDDWAGPAD